MKRIEVYDFEAKKLDEVADMLGCTIADVVEQLVDGYLDDVVEDMK